MRKDNKVASHILADSSKIKKDLAAEERARHDRYIVQQRQNNRNRRWNTYDRESR